MGEVADYLAVKGLKSSRRGDNAILNCPFCGDTEHKFAINLNTGAWNCKRLNHCGKKGYFPDFQREMGDEPTKQKKPPVMLRKKSYKKPQADIIPASEKVAGYLKKRGFTQKTIDHFQVGEKDGKVALPYYKDGTLVNIKYRSVGNKEMFSEKECEPILFGRDLITQEALFITEGEFDAMALYQYGFEAVSVPNGASGHTWVENEWDYLETFSAIYLCFDTDEAGERGAKELSMKLGEARCFRVRFPEKDANDCLLKGVSIEEMTNCFITATEMAPDTIARPEDFRDEVFVRFFDAAKMIGTSTPWEGLTKKLRGWRFSELTIISGYNGSGKSTILGQIIIDLIKKGNNIYIYSGEMHPSRMLKWLIVQYLAKSNPSPDEVDRALKFFNNNMIIENITASISKEDLFRGMKYSSQRYGVSFFFIDSLMKIQLPKADEYIEQQEFMNELVGVNVKYNAHTFIVCHPRKASSDEREAGKMDIKGSSHITDVADNVIMIQRISEKKKHELIAKGKSYNDMIMEVVKNREWGEEGIIKMNFSVDSRLYEEET